MKESDLRKLHLNLAVLLFAFVILQAGSGLFITLINLSVPHTHAHGNAQNHIEGYGQQKSMVYESNMPVGDAEQVDRHKAEKSTQNETHVRDHASGHTETHQPEKSSWTKSLELIHHGGGAIGTIYRLIVGTGLLLMAISGCMIFVKVRARTKKT